MYVEHPDVLTAYKKKYDSVKDSCNTPHSASTVCLFDNDIVKIQPNFKSNATICLRRVICHDSFPIFHEYVKRNIVVITER